MVSIIQSDVISCH